MRNLKVAFFSAIVALNLLANQTNELETIIVNDQINEANTKIGETDKSQKTLTKQQAQDSRDIVKYETGVSVVEKGRSGASGYAIRGVDENRVSIVVDGLRQAETIQSQGFKEIFEGYGNFNNTRNSVEVENLKGVKIKKGADSVKTGSGSLGGSVIFDTKDARDFLIDKDYYYGLKMGYLTQDNQFFHSHTLAGRYKWFDILVVKTLRKGHELENFGYKDLDPLKVGKTREKTDPYKITKDNTLVKASFQPSEEHRLTISNDAGETKTRGVDYSYSLNSSTYTDIHRGSLRHADDLVKRNNFAISYENFTQTPFWDTAKISFSNQKIKTRAINDEYCDVGDECKTMSNPDEIQLVNGKISDKYGGEFGIKRVGNDDIIVDSKGEPIQTTGQRFSDHWIDCSIFDCSNNEFEAFKKDTEYYQDQNGNYTSRQVITKEKLQLDREHEFNGVKFKNSSRANYKYTILIPNSPGYKDRIWKKRDLDTNAKQVNLDFTKEFETLSLEHSLSYGASYTKTLKKMVNWAGYDGTQAKWWAKRSLGMSIFDVVYTCENSSTFNGNLCPKNEAPTSFLIPITSKEAAFYIADDVKFNDYLGFDFGYRFDDVRYRSNYIPGVTPKIADDMVVGLFVPLPTLPTNQAQADAIKRQNAIDNINYLSRPKKFQNHSYSFGANFTPLDFLKFQAKYSKGFRAPTGDELYFTFKHPDVTILPNITLEPEIGKTSELAMTLFDEDYGFITASVFQTKYKNFIDMEYKGRKDYNEGRSSRSYVLYQNVNRENAKVSGFEINSKLLLGKVFTPLQGFNVSYKLTHQKGRVNGNIPMNAIQPTTQVFGVGYQSKMDKFGADLYITKVAEKKAVDTYNMFYKEQGTNDSTLKHRSGRYTILDLITYIKPMENLTLRLGVYNIANKKYATWESIRSIRPFGTSNLIDQNTGEGINRFNAPGRNYRLTFEYNF